MIATEKYKQTNRFFTNTEKYQQTMLSLAADADAKHTG